MKGNRTTGMRGYALLTPEARKANASRAGKAAAVKYRAMKSELATLKAKQTEQEKAA